MKTHNHCGPRLCDSGSDEGDNIIHAGDRTYNLDTKKGQEAFDKDIADLKLDGKAGDALGGCADGVWYDKDTHEVGVGDKRYDLDNKKERAAFEADAADGFIDGKTVQGDKSHITIGDKTYDLTTRRGRREFEDDINDGTIPSDGATYDRKTNKLTLDGKEYDLDHKSQVKAFERDIHDGSLDGKDSRHLRNVRVGGEEHNLATEEGRASFAETFPDLALDDGATYNPETNIVTAGDREYDLNDPKQLKAFQKDAADGAIDGRKSPHLHKFEVDGEEYDLTTLDGRQKLADALAYGTIYSSADDVSYNPDNGIATIDGKEYNLRDPKQARAFQKDAADGDLDGQIARANSRV